MDDNLEAIQEEIHRLKKEKEEREAALPAHSIRPHQLIAIEELEDEINRKETELALLRSRS